MSEKAYFTKGEIKIDDEEDFSLKEIIKKNLYLSQIIILFIKKAIQKKTYLKIIHPNKKAMKNLK